MNAGTSGLAFRPDIEGLRGIAILLVLLFHARTPGFGGGFVGVDVFFVISGFLITGLLVRELDARGRIDLAAFYARRARRLLPAAALVLAATLIAAAILLPPLLAIDTAKDAVAAAFYVANIRFARQAVDYFETESAPPPLLHYWSLGVEEQFYLAWPLLLVATVMLQRALYPRAVALHALLAFSSLAGAASFALSVYLTGVSQPWAFYSLPTKAWELALGACVALGASRGHRLPATFAAACSLLGIVLVVASASVISAETLFPGVAALFPAVGAALVIAGGLSGGVFGSLLGSPLLRWVGRISYSLYLWHWPMLVIPQAIAGASLPWPWRAGLAAASIALAAVCARWVEEPIRAGRWVGFEPRRTLRWAILLVLASASIALAVGWSAARRLETGTPPASEALVDRQLEAIFGGMSPAAPALPGPVPRDLAPPLMHARRDFGRLFVDGCMVGARQTTLGDCVYGAAGSGATMVLFGDSHAAQWFPALERIAQQQGWRLVVLTKTQCPAVDHPVWNPQAKRVYAECEAWRTAALRLIAAQRPQLVVVSNSVFARLAIDGRPVPGTAVPESWDAALGRTLAQLRASARHVALIADTPHSLFTEPAVCLSGNMDDASRCATPLAAAVDARRVESERKVAAAAGAGFIDPARWLCIGSTCPAVIGSALVYRDESHMTSVFARALAPYVARELPPPAP